ncbi:MAG: hypothetical protein GXO64_03720 [Candidatus Micrarchaeota archaeon]|nr:hypothetical protein [Candidatus Micrarchaeota archaeon]
MTRLSPDIRALCKKLVRKGLKCAKIMGTAPSETAVVGGQDRGGIRIGESLGMKAIWLRKGIYADVLPSEPSEDPDYVITELNELKDILRMQ